MALSQSGGESKHRHLSCKITQQQIILKAMFIRIRVSLMRCSASRNLWLVSRLCSAVDPPTQLPRNRRGLVQRPSLLHLLTNIGSIRTKIRRVSQILRRTKSVSAGSNFGPSSRLSRTRTA